MDDKRTETEREGKPEQPRIAPVVQPEDMDEEDRAILKALAELEHRSALSLREITMTEMLHSSRWMQASLLLINGGGAVAMLAHEGTPTVAKVVAAACFVLGILLSLLSSYLAFLASVPAVAKMTQAAGYWLTVTIDLLRSEEWEEDILTFQEAFPKRFWWGKVTSWSSAILFAIGCAVAGAGMLLSVQNM